VPINVRPFVPSRLTRRPGHESGRIPTSAVAGYIALTKPRIIELLLITTIPTMVVANNGWPSLWLMVVTMVGAT
jgi:protoheme IX farnesyltransferase